MLSPSLTRYIIDSALLMRAINPRISVNQYPWTNLSELLSIKSLFLIIKCFHSLFLYNHALYLFNYYALQIPLREREQLKESRITSTPLLLYPSSNQNWLVKSIMCVCVYVQTLTSTWSSFHLWFHYNILYLQSFSL